MPTYITLVCRICGKGFEAEVKRGPNPTICSEECRRKNNVQKVTKYVNKTKTVQCKNCGKGFHAKHLSNPRKGMFCGRECVREYSKKYGKYAVESKCLFCGNTRKLFSNRLFCDVKCKRAWVESKEEFSNIEKQCTQCLEVKKLYEYNVIQDKEDKLIFTSICTKCKSTKSNKNRTPELARDNHLSYNYGIDQRDFDEMFEKQGRRCNICKRNESEITQDGYKAAAGKFHVDHDHQTNKIRGILCHSCNIGLGKFKDNIQYLLNAIDHIKQGLER